MKRITKLPVLIAVSALLFVHAATAQYSAYHRAPAERAGWWTLGLNAGLAYQTGDVCIDPGGWGAGITLAKNLYYRQGAALAFDLRGRMLYTKTLGLDDYRHYGIDKNSALNNTWGLDYVSSPGYVFANYRTDMGEMALEGVFTFNRLRERTGIVLSLYGGVGLDWYRARIDQEGEYGTYEPYYEVIDTTQRSKAIRTDLQYILDGKYETNADGFHHGFGKIGIMPAAGLELGYQLSPRFYASIGHKMTFSGTDLLDGQQWNSDNTATGNNDLHHYTSFDLKWVIQAGEKIKKPEISLREPARSPYTSQRRDYVVRAQVLHVRSGADIHFIFNGRSAPFDFRDNVLTAYVDLHPGRNTAIITASNQAGSDREDVLLFYEEPKYIPPGPGVPPGPPPNPHQPPPPAYAPSVEITVPGSPEVTSNSQTYQVRARIRYAAAHDVRLYINGRSSGNFYLQNEDFSATIQLERGTNQVRITAENPRGKDEDRVNILYEVQRPGNSPTVTITDPAVATSQTTETTAQIRAEIRYVGSKSDIRFEWNGMQVYDFEYSLSTGIFSKTVALQPGDNTAVIKATNAYGSDEDDATIRRIGQIHLPKPPVVTLLEPADNSIFSRPEVTLKAEVQHITDKSQITVKVNGSVFNGFSFDKINHRISGPITLIPGANTIYIKAVNADGSDEVNATVRYQAPVLQPPVVAFVSPANNSQATQLQVTVKATIQHITGKQDIVFTVNGTNQSLFTYAPATKVLEATVTLQGGTNSIRIRATNADGSDEETLNLRYTAPLPAPEVVITQPSANPFPTNQSQAAVKATVRNVRDRSDISMTVNGKPFTNFNYNTSTKELEASVPLANGKNDVVVRAATTAGSGQDAIAIQYSAPQPPSVTLQTPKNGSTVNSAAQTVTATITGVKSAAEISFFVNGTAVTTFSYATGKFNGSCTLKPGANTLRITARNANGSDEASAAVTYTPLQPKPVVVFVTPKKAGTIVTKANIQVTATIQHVTDKKQVSFKVDGKLYSAFQFDAKSGTLTASILLNPGETALQIEAVNASGKAVANSSVVFQENVSQPPVVTILSLSQPTANPMNPDIGRSTILATITHTMGRKGITLTVNGQPVSGFSFDATTHTLQHVIDLQRGVNTVKIRATNADGADEETRTVEW